MGGRAGQCRAGGLTLDQSRIKGSGAGMEPGPDAVWQDGWWVSPGHLQVPALSLAASGATGEAGRCAPTASATSSVRRQGHRSRSRPVPRYLEKPKFIAIGVQRHVSTPRTLLRPSRSSIASAGVRVPTACFLTCQLLIWNMRWTVFQTSPSSHATVRSPKVGAASIIAILMFARSQSPSKRIPFGRENIRCKLAAWFSGCHYN